MTLIFIKPLEGEGEGMRQATMTRVSTRLRVSSDGFNPDGFKRINPNRSIYYARNMVEDYQY